VLEPGVESGKGSLAPLPAAIQDGGDLPVEVLPRPRSNRLRSMNSVLQTEHGTVRRSCDRRLNCSAGLNRDRVSRTGYVLDASLHRPHKRNPGDRRRDPQHANAEYGEQCWTYQHASIPSRHLPILHSFFCRAVSAIDHHLSDPEAKQALESAGKHFLNGATQSGFGDLGSTGALPGRPFLHQYSGALLPVVLPQKVDTQSLPRGERTVE
jgi:hypothetical protein